MNTTKFYDIVREEIGPLSQDFVDGTNALLNEGMKREMRLEHQAYILATSYHETAMTMQPIAEYGKGKGKAYLTYYNSSKTKKCIYKPQEAYGRGYVQLTWEANYERADKECGLNGALIKNFEYAMEPDIAADIIFKGMLEGWFTGKKLNDYINDYVIDYYNARRVVNGTDKAEQIKSYAIWFEKALRESGWGEVKPEPPEPAPTPPQINQDLLDALSGLQDAYRHVIEAIERVKYPSGG